MNVATLLSVKARTDPKLILLTPKDMESVQRHAIKVFGGALQRISGVPVQTTTEGVSRVILQNGESVPITEKEKPAG